MRRRSERPSSRSGSGSKPPSVTEGRTGCVVESYGRRVVVLTADTAERLSCKIRGRRTEVVAGDVGPARARNRGADSEYWVVAERLPRRNVLQRTDSRGGVEDIASNLDQLGIVVAPRPTCDPFIIDRYLAGAGYAGIEPLLILNKQDLIGAGEFGPEEFAFIDTYRQIGIPW